MAKPQLDLIVSAKQLPTEVAIAEMPIVREDWCCGGVCEVKKSVRGESVGK